MISITLSLSTLTNPRGITMFAVIIAYPILDAILMVPAISILVNFKNEPLWFTPWICESLGIFLIAISDSWFALVVLTSLVQLFWLSAFFRSSLPCYSCWVNMVYQILSHDAST